MVYHRKRRAFLIKTTAILPAGARTPNQDSPHGMAKRCSLLVFLFRGAFFYRQTLPTAISAISGLKIVAEPFKPSAGISHLCGPEPALGLFYFQKRNPEDAASRISAKKAHCPEKGIKVVICNRTTRRFADLLEMPIVEAGECPDWESAPQTNLSGLEMQDWQ